MISQYNFEKRTISIIRTGPQMPSHQKSSEKKVQKLLLITVL